MRKITVPTPMKTLIVSLAALAVAASAFAEQARYVVATRGAARSAPIQIVRDPVDIVERSVRTFQSVNAFAADLTVEEVAELRRSPYVRYVQKVVPHVAFATEAAAVPVSGRRYSHAQTVPWGIDNIRTRDVWPVTRGEGINVAILDTGLDAAHPDLQVRFKGGFNSFNASGNVHDENKHGTHVAGTVAALDNNMGVVGVAQGVDLWVMKVLDRSGNGTDETVVAGLDWVLQKKREIGGRWIVSLSLGSAEDTQLAREAFARAITEGVLVVAAAGNGGMASVSYPAAYPSVIAVSAIDALDTRARFSSYGTEVTFAAPGVSVLSTVPVGTYAVADVTLPDNSTVDGAPLVGSPKGDVGGQYVFCGLGRPEDFPPTARGNIAVVRRGEIYFRDKARNAKAAGATAVVVISDERQDWTSWTLLPPFCDENNRCSPLPEDLTFEWPLTVAVAKTSGDKLLGMTGETLVSNRNEDYAALSGTSMATPHVAGVAALVWSLAPNASAEQVRIAMKMTARDLGPKDWDWEYGYGVIDALKAARQIAPGTFGLPPQPPPSNPRRPVTRR